MRSFLLAHSARVYYCWNEKERRVIRAIMFQVKSHDVAEELVKERERYPNGKNFNLIFIG